MLPNTPPLGGGGGGGAGDADSAAGAHAGAARLADAKCSGAAGFGEWLALLNALLLNALNRAPKPGADFFLAFVGR